MDKPILVAMRADEMDRAHPHTDWSHVCAWCGARLGIYPLGQRAMAAQALTVICSQCYDAIPDKMPCLPCSEALQEALESIDFTKKKPQ